MLLKIEPESTISLANLLLSIHSATVWLEINQLVIEHTKMYCIRQWMEQKNNPYPQKLEI